MNPTLQEIQAMPCVIWKGMRCRTHLFSAGSPSALSRKKAVLKMEGWQFNDSAKVVQLGHGPCHQAGYFPEILADAKQKELVNGVTTT